MMTTNALKIFNGVLKGVELYQYKH